MEQLQLHQYLLASEEFYEPISKYPANDDDFFSLASSFLPDAWNVARYNHWYSCTPRKPASRFRAGRSIVQHVIGGGWVVLFFQRLLTHCRAPFMVDELLESSTIDAGKEAFGGEGDR